jgi:hypothetical protein
MSETSSPKLAFAVGERSSSARSPKVKGLVRPAPGHAQSLMHKLHYTSDDNQYARAHNAGCDNSGARSRACHRRAFACTRPASSKRSRGAPELDRIRLEHVPPQRSASAPRRAKDARTRLRLARLDRLALPRGPAPRGPGGRVAQYASDSSPESRARCPRRAPVLRRAASRRRARPGSRPARALAALVAVKNVKPRSWRLSAAHPRRGRPSRRRFAIVIASGSLDARGPAPPRDHSCEVASGSLHRQRSRAARGPPRARRANRRDLSSGARRRLRRRRRRAARARARRGDAYAPASSPASARRQLDARSRVHGKFSNQFAWLGSGRSPSPPPAPLARPPAVEDRLRSPGALRPTRARVEPPASCPPWPLTSRKRRKPLAVAASRAGRADARTVPRAAGRAARVRGERRRQPVGEHGGRGPRVGRASAESCARRGCCPSPATGSRACSVRPTRSSTDPVVRARGNSSTCIQFEVADGSHDRSSVRMPAPPQRARTSASTAYPRIRRRRRSIRAASGADQPARRPPSDAGPQPQLACAASMRVRERQPLARPCSSCPQRRPSWHVRAREDEQEPEDDVREHGVLAERAARRRR